MTRFPHSPTSALASAAASLLLALPAAAEHAAPPTTGSAMTSADPADAKAAVPSVGYRSAFSGYRPLFDGKVGWKQANDEVGRIGGWRTYARQANAPEPAASAPPAKPAGHGSHGDHGAAHKK